MVDANRPNTLPVETFFSSRGARWGFRVSPDGQRLLWLTIAAGKAVVQVRRLRGGVVTTLEAEHPIKWAYWAADSRHVAVWGDRRGDENYQPSLVDLENPKRAPRELVPGADVRVYYQQQLSSREMQMLVRHNSRDRSLTDLYRIDLRTGQQQLLERNAGNVDRWLTDQNGTPILRRHRHADFSWHIERLDAPGAVLLSGGADEYLEPHGHPPPGSTWGWALSNRDRDRIALVKLDLKTGVETLVYGHPAVDVSGVWIDDRTNRPLAAWSWPDYMQVKSFDPIAGEILSHLVDEQPLNVYFDSWSDDKDLVVLRVGQARGGERSLLFERGRNRLVELGRSPLADVGDQLATMQPISYKSRDGLVIHGYLTLPAGEYRSPLPTVLTVHGGPFARDVWGYRAVDQFLANRGYAVLRVNYRGSTGYGRSFTEAARGEFAGAMHTDLIDGVEWLVAQGVSDPLRIAIQGHSFGGFAALIGLTMTPSRYAAGVNLMGPANLTDLIDAGPAYWKLYRSRWHRFIGDPDNAQDRADMAARSPINFLSHVERPLLIVHGANDVRVSKHTAEQIVNTLRAHGKEVEYLLFEGEGHSLQARNNQIRFALALESFLGEHLGGRVCRRERDQLSGVRKLEDR